MAADRRTMEQHRSFAEFWPYYVAQHGRPATRWLHFCGTTMALSVFVVALVTQRWVWLAAVPLAGYGLAWVGHFAAEGNRPASFKHPLWSLAADFRMWWLMLVGRMEREVDRCCSPPTKRKASPESQESGITA